jgi:hypothetical protein
MIPPKLERPASGPKKKRIKASGEAGKRGPSQCKKVLSIWTYREGLYNYSS